MRKTIYTIGLVSCFFITSQAQVGINNTLPQATLDVTAKTTDGSKPEGIIAPRLTGDQIQAADSQYAAPQKGTVIYATAAVTTPSVKTNNITAEGYYYFDGNFWQKFNTGAFTSLNIYNSNGALTDNRDVNTASYTLNWNSGAVSSPTMRINANSLTSSQALAINTNSLGSGQALSITGGTNGGITTGSLILASGQNSSTNTNGLLKVTNTAASGSGTFATLQANNTAGSGVNILNNGNVGIGTSTPSSTLEVNGSMAAAYKEITTSVTLTDKDHYINFTGTTASTVTLPVTNGTTATTGFFGREYQIRNAGTAALTISGAAASNELINTANAAISQTIIVPAGYVAIIKRNDNITSGSKERWLLTLLVPTTGTRLVGNGLYYATTATDYASFENTTSYNGTYPSNPNITDYTIVPFGTINVPNDGSYLFSVRWWGTTTGVKTVGSSGSTSSNLILPSLTSAYFILYNVTQNKALDQVEYYVTTTASQNMPTTAYYPFTFTINLLGTDLKANDLIRVMVRPSIGHNTNNAKNAFKWQTGYIGAANASGNFFKPSLLVVQQ